jgi:hypothetical protein
MKRDQLFPSRFVRAADLKGAAHTVIIESVGLEQIDEERSKPVARFENRARGLVLNATNYDAVAQIYGDETDDWIGQPIQLYPTKVPFKGKLVDAVRVRAAPPATPDPAPAPKPKPGIPPKPAQPDSDFDDEIPF